MPISGIGHMGAGDRRGKQLVALAMGPHDGEDRARGIENTVQICAKHTAPNAQGTSARSTATDRSRSSAQRCRFAKSRPSWCQIPWCVLQSKYIDANELGTHLACCGASGCIIDAVQHEVCASLPEAKGHTLSNRGRGIDNLRQAFLETARHASLLRMVCLKVSSITAASTRRP